MVNLDVTHLKFLLTLQNDVWLFSHEQNNRWAESRRTVPIRDSPSCLMWNFYECLLLWLVWGQCRTEISHRAEEAAHVHKKPYSAPGRQSRSPLKKEGSYSSRALQPRITSNQTLLFFEDERRASWPNDQILKETCEDFSSRQKLRKMRNQCFKEDFNFHHWRFRENLTLLSVYHSLQV